ncbi:thiamine pyrophosphate-binding protein, partial [Hydrogenimonas sp.]
MKVSDYIAEFLAQNGIDKVFGYIGGNNAHIFDSIDKWEGIEIVNSRHEQGSGFAAEGYARATGKTGVATVTSGPGGTNLVTPIASCFLDSIPSLFIVGDINSFERDKSRGLRQIGFQDIDIAEIVKPITKHAVFVDNLENLRFELEKCHYLAQEGRKGPTLICIPVNFQYQEGYEPEKERSFFESEEYALLSSRQPHIDDATIEKAAEWINDAQRPVILAGHGVRLSDAEEVLNRILEKTQFPLVHSLMGKDVGKADYPYNLGFIGRWGNRYGNLTLANADLIIALGSRLDALQTGRNTKEFAKHARIIQVDIDGNELAGRIPIDLPILGNVKEFLEKLETKELSPRLETWHEKVLEYKKRFPHIFEIDGREKLGNKAVSLLSRFSREGDIYTVDVGENQMVAAQAIDVKADQRVLFTGGLGSMGFALPAAIGAALGTGRRSIVISGDGGFQMNIQELEVIRHRHLPVKIFILNNASLYMVTQMQNAFLAGKHVGTKEDYSAPDFQNVGEAYGIRSHKIFNLDQLEKILESGMQNDDPEIFEFIIPGEKMTVSPLLDYSRPYEDMMPHL